MSERIIAYIDGFNLYRGMRAAKMQHLFWLDLNKLIRRISPKDSHVVGVKYFTARILNLKDKTDPQHAEGEASRKRQTEYIDALKSTGIQVFEGKYKRRKVRCHSCDSEWIKPEEKATDVQIATQLLSDAFRGNFDSALVVTGDADVVPALRVVVAELELPVIVAFPPKRILAELKETATSVLHLNAHDIGKCQLPESFDHDGHTFSRPENWKTQKKTMPESS